MRSLVTAVIAAIEAVAVALAGIAVVAVPAVLIWVITFGLSAEPASVAAGVTGVWLLAHFVPLQFSVSPEAALGLGLAPEALSFSLSLAPLGITLVSVLLALRAGWRFAGRGGVGAMGVVGGVAGFGAVALAAAAFAAPLIEWTAMQAALSAAAVYGASSAAAFLTRAGRDGHPWWEASVRQALRGLEYVGVRSGAALPGRAAEMFRLVGAALALVFGISALVFAVAVATGYADVTALAQSLQLDPIGSLTLFLAQLALVPLAIVWSLAWMSGTGFAIGAGSSVTPFETLLGPLPALPLLGALPEGWGERGAFVPGVLVVAALGLGVLFARRPGLRRASWPAAVAIAVLAAVFTGLVVAGVSALARGSMGPDRLAVNGPDPWHTGGVVALEVGAGLLIGVVLGRLDAAKVRAALPDAVPGSGLLSRTRGPATAAQTPEADVDVDFETAVDQALELANDRITAPFREHDAAASVEARETDSYETESLETEAYETSSFETEELTEEDRRLADRSETPDRSEKPDRSETPDRAETPEAAPGVDEPTDEAALLEAYAWDADTAPGAEPAEPTETGHRSGWRWPGRGH